MLIFAKPLIVGFFPIVQADIINPEDLVHLVRTFGEFCLEHPWLSMPVALLIFISIFVHLSKVLGTFINSTLKLFMHGSSLQRASTGLLIVVLLAVSVSAPWIARRLNRPKPEFVNLPSPSIPTINETGNRTGKVIKLLTHDFKAEWKYPDADGRTAYMLLVNDKRNRRRVTYPTNSPFVRVKERGPLSLQVIATHPDKTTDKSSLLELEVYNDSIERLKESNEIVIGVHQDNSDGVFCYSDGDVRHLERDGTSKGYEGFDIDLVELIRKGLSTKYGLPNLKATARHIPWPDIIQRPNTYDIDFAIASISVTPERKKTVLFSDPYWETQIAVIQPKPSDKILSNTVSMEELAEYHVAVHHGTTALKLVEALGKSFPTFQYDVAKDNTELFRWLNDRHVDAVLYDYERTFAETKQNPSLIVRTLNREQFNVEPEKYGITFAKVNRQLQEDVNGILHTHRGELKDLMVKRIERAAPALQLTAQFQP
ncbi:MAG TPA: ABC transporter substrate-binding protein [Nitrospiraceae bacterium]|nr:ABC transporter substrate-binding protein [Nitrospiraceae bacterium]